MKNIFVAGIVLGMLSYYALTECDLQPKQLLKKFSRKMDI